MKIFRFLRRVAGAGLLGFFFVAPVAHAVPIANSLWIGNDLNPTLPVLNTNRSGTVLQSFTSTAIGFGVDLANNVLYVNDTGGRAVRYNLNTLTPTGTPVAFSVTSEDISFDGTNLLIGDFGGNNVLRVNPTTGTVVSTTPVGFAPLGLTWDGGTGFWADPFVSGGAVTHFNAAGTVLSSFVPFPNNYAGGLGYDTTDGTLWIGTFNNVFHYTTAGVQLGSFATPDSRFVDGLEFEAGSRVAAVPEPGTLALVGIGLAGLASLRRRRNG